MSAYTNQPDNLNFLSPLGFKFNIKKTPTFNHFVQSVSIPNLTLGTVSVETPFVRLPVPGDKLQFSELLVTFRVDEDMLAYTEIHEWLEAVGFPDNFDQFKVVAPTATAGGTANNVGTAGIMTGEGVYSDATLTVLNSAMNPRIRINYQDLYPTSLSDTTFNASLTDVDYLECTATFAYKRYKIERI